MRAGSLAGVLIAAKLITVAGRALPLSIWLPSALLWHDIAIGLAFAGVVRYAGWRRPVRALYWALVVWIAVNVPVARTLSTPVTVPMLRATGGALSDSILLYATPANIGLMLVVLVIAALLPRLQWPAKPRARWALALALGAIALPGPFVDTTLDMRGTHRNALTTVLASGIPRVDSIETGRSGEREWRHSPFATTPATDLRWLEGSAAGRNVLLIALESTGSRYLRTYGAPDDPTPTLTALTANAVQFDAAYAVYPESIKGLFAVLCSRHPAMDVSVVAHAGASCAPLAGTLAAHGYRTALFHSGRFAYLGMEKILASQRFHQLEDAGTIGGQVESSFGVDEPSTVARILAWIDDHDPARPFFVSYMPVAGHHPYDAPTRDPFPGDDELSTYKNALHYGDRSLATLLEGLRARNLLQKTVVVLFADHGEAFWQHDGNYGHTFFAFDENIRVPLVVAIPGITTAAIRSTRVASVVDIAPTILSLLGIPPPATYEGSSLLDPRQRMALFFTDYALAWAGLRDGCWKYLLEMESDRSHLFDVCRDPDESVDHASGQPGHVAIYRQRTLDWIAATRASYTTRRRPRRMRSVT